MIKVLCKNKKGNRVISYTCTDGKKNVDLTKDQLTEYIDKKMVENARKQVYNGTVIIRLKDAIPEKEVTSVPVNNTPVPKKSTGTAKKVNKQEAVESVPVSNKEGTENNKMPVDNNTSGITSTTVGRPVINAVNCDKKLSFKRVDNLKSVVDKATKSPDKQVSKYVDDIYIIISASSVVFVSDKIIQLDNNLSERGAGTFANTSFISIDFTNTTTQYVKDMRNMFNGCKAKDIKFNGFDTSNVEDMSGMFCRCEARKLDLTNFNTSKVKGMNSMFYEYGAKELDLSSFDASAVEDVRDMFNGCKLNSLNLSNFKSSKVAECSTMFYSAKIRNLNLNGMELSNVEVTENMFGSAEIPVIDFSKAKFGRFNSGEAEKVKFCDQMFYNCKASTIKLGKFNISKDSSVRKMFTGCNAEVTPKSVYKLVQNKNGVSVSSKTADPKKSGNKLFRW